LNLKSTMYSYLGDFFCKRVSVCVTTLCTFENGIFERVIERRSPACVFFFRVQSLHYVVFLVSGISCSEELNSVVEDVVCFPLMLYESRCDLS